MPSRSSSFESRCRAGMNSCRRASRGRGLDRGRLPQPASVSAPAPPHPGAGGGPVQSVTGIGLHPITRRALQPRRRRDLAPHARRRQCAGQPEPRRTSLIHRSCRLRQPTEPLQHLRGLRDQPRPEHLAGLPGRSPPPPPIARARPARHSYALETPGPPHTCRTGRARKRARQPTRLREPGPGQQPPQPRERSLHTA